MILNKAILAVIYLNLEQPNRYNIEISKERDNARAIFARRVKYDKEKLDKTFEIYEELLAKETELFFRISTCLAKKLKVRLI